MEQINKTQNQRNEISPNFFAQLSYCADFSFIAGGVVPGIRILKPDFPENKEEWPFLWGENEYVIDIGADFILLSEAVNDLINEK